MAATARNFGISQRERERRLSGLLDDPYDSTAIQALADPAGNAFYGSLREQAGLARANGLDYRVNFGGFGAGPQNDSPAHGLLNPLELQAQKEAAISRAADIEAQRRFEERFVQESAAEARRRQIVNDLDAAHQNHLATTAMTPPMEPMHRETTIEPGKAPKYTIRPAGTLLEQSVNRLPPSQRAQYDLQQRKLADDRAFGDRKLAIEEGKATAKNEPSDDIRLAVEAMKTGSVPPQLPGRASKDYIAIMAEAKRQGYDLATAATDWQAAQTHFRTLNGAQQTRIRQGVDTAYHSLDLIDELADKWKGGRFPLLNAASLKLAKSGAFGGDAQSIATQLEAQITDLTSELGNVYMGGNSPTDHALSLAAKNLSANWSNDVLRDMTQLARKNLEMRRNSIANVGAIGASANNPYVPTQAPPAAAPAPGGGGRAGGPGSQSAAVMMQAPDGSTAWVDPANVAAAEAKGAKRIH